MWKLSHVRSVVAGRTICRANASSVVSLYSHSARIVDPAGRAPVSTKAAIRGASGEKLATSSRGAFVTGSAAVAHTTSLSEGMGEAATGGEEDATGVPGWRAPESVSGETRCGSLQPTSKTHAAAMRARVDQR